jgi:hypothetical protein
MELMSTFTRPPFRIHPELNSDVFVIQGCDMYPRDALNCDSFMHVNVREDIGFQT